MKEEKILIIDDEPVARGTMRKILEGEGYHVLAVASAGEALRQAKKEDFDLVLADNITHNGGPTLVKELRQVSPDIIPLLIMGRADIKTARAAMRIGVYDCIAKPFERSELCATIVKALRRRQLIDEALYRKRLIEEAQNRTQPADRDSLLQRVAGFMK